MNWKWLYARLVFLPTLVWNVLLGRVLCVRHWWDEVHPQVILGARPFRCDVAKLANLGVGGVVNTCEEFRGPIDLYQQHSIAEFWIPTVDFTHPSLFDVQRAVQFMEQQMARGKKVYVHCKAGRGRSATVVCCWLIKSQGLTPEAAQQILSARRPHVNQHLADRPVIKEFYSQLNTQNQSHPPQ